jgi:outer membrane protein assembly factor BamD
MTFRSSHFADARTLRLLALILAALMSLTSGCRKDVEFDDDRPAAELYADAKQALDNKSWDQAIRTYKYLQTRYPFGRYTEQSMLDLSYAHFKAHEGQNALSTLNRFIRTYPTHPNVDYAFYLKGLVNYEENLGFLERLMPKRVRDRDQTRLRDAFVDFSELLRRYPDSRYVPDARQRMVYLRKNRASTWATKPILLRQTGRDSRLRPTPTRRKTRKPWLCCISRMSSST